MATVLRLEMSLELRNLYKFEKNQKANNNYDSCTADVESYLIGLN